MILIRNLLLASALALIGGCASQPPAPSPDAASHAAHQQHLASLAPIKDYALKGRLGVVTQKQGFSGSIQWRHYEMNDQIEVYSPLGAKVATIEKTPAQVTLTEQNGHTVSAQDAESLTETTMGFRLPLKGLSDWALGRPTSSKIEASQWDVNGRLTALKQDGWDISYENYAQTSGIFVPSKIVLKSEKVNLKLLVETWHKVSP